MMATAKTPVKAVSGKRPAPAPAVAPAQKPKPATLAKVAAKAKPVTKTTPKATPKATAAKPQRSPAKKPAGIPPEQRRYYVEVAAYHIAERRGFAPGNPLEDWVQAEAEIDQLLAKGLLGK